MSRKFDPAVEFFCLAAVIFLFGAGYSAAAQNQIEPASLKAGDNYRIGVGDVLRVTVLKQALLSVDGVRVSNDGTIRLPMLDADLRAACRTESELLAVIANEYKKFLLNPQIYVAVKEYNANPVAVVGAVITPGRFQMQRPMRLLEILTYVSGPAPNAGKNIQIIRSQGIFRCEQVHSENAEAKAAAATTNEAGQEIITLPLSEVLKGGEKANPFLLGGDVVSIAEAEVRQAFIIGNVRAAAIINLKEPVTLTKAIAMAGGAAPGANVEKIRISRQPADSLSKLEYVVNLKDINKRLRDDFPLEPNDIIDVPGPSGARKFIKDILRTATPMITGVPIIIP